MEPLVLLILVLALSLTLLLLLLWRARSNKWKGPVGPAFCLFAYSPILTWFRRPHRNRPPQDDGHVPQRQLRWPVVAVEWAVIALWAAWIARDLLDLDPFIWPSGWEFGTQILSLHFWEDLKSCGLCALWNGWVNGGSPALADPFGSTLHPISMITTLLWGVVNGAKLTFVGSLWMAGIAQWWISRSLGLGRAARLWAAGIAVAGGHLVGRLHLGAVGLTLSIAAASLVLAAILDLGLTRRRVAALRLAVVGSMAIVAGHGYMQFALLWWFLPLCLLVGIRDPSAKRVWAEFFLAAGVAASVTAVFLVPWLHFWPHTGKFVDAGFESAQPLAYIFPNLVIGDWDFYRTTAMEKWPYPYLYSLHIGWIPTLLSVLGLPLARRIDRQSLLFLLAGAGTMIALASGLPFRILVGAVPGLMGLRHTPVFASLAVPAILGVSAYGLDRLIHMPWDRPWRKVGARDFGLVWTWAVRLILAVAFAISLREVAAFATDPMAMIDRSDFREAIEPWREPDSQWTGFPYAEHTWVEVAVDLGMKVTGAPTAWWWDQRPLPPPFIEISRNSLLQPAVPIGSIRGIPVYLHPENAYAAVVTSDGYSACEAVGRGGDILVACSSPETGVLIVRENNWAGWRVWLDGEAAPLGKGPWLEVDAPAGMHGFRFRYLPWDVAVGAAVSLLGWLWLGWLGWKEVSTSSSILAVGHWPLT